MYVCMYACMYACMYLRIHIYTSLSLSMMQHRNCESAQWREARYWASTPGGTANIDIKNTQLQGLKKKNASINDLK